MAALTKRAPGSHGVQPLSTATRRRMLAALVAKAESGDPVAMAELVRLSLEAERHKAQAA